MRRFSIFILFLLLPTIALIGKPRSNPTLYIQGQIQEADQSIVPNARVCAYPQDRPINGAQPCGTADDHGNFTIDIPVAGKYTVVAAKEEDRYPNRFYGIYGAPTNGFTAVSVQDGSPALDVVVDIGSKAGMLSGVVTDSQTGQVVESVDVIICDAQNQSQCDIFTTGYPGGQFHLLVPTSPFTVKVKAAGFHDWYAIDGNQENTSAISIPPGGEKMLKIAMQSVN